MAEVRAVARRRFHPRGIILRPRDNLTRCLVPLKLDEHQRSVRGDGERIDDTTELGFLLPANQHPLSGQDGGALYDHVLQ